jgi:hypothetical protein
MIVTSALQDDVCCQWCRRRTNGNHQCNQFSLALVSIYVPNVFRFWSYLAALPFHYFLVFIVLTLFWGTFLFSLFGFRLSFPTMKSANFEECGARYLNDTSLIERWNYTGPVRLIPANPRTQITYAGCKALCGTGNDWYPWSVSSQFITTWVLPIIGTLLQAPFESNAFWRTVKASCRWLGSPMASLSYILWNIEVSGNCALCG